MNRKNLKNCRLNKGYTQKELAQKVGVSERYYQNIEYGKTIPSATTFLAIAKTLGIDTKKLDHLLEQED